MFFAAEIQKKALKSLRTVFLASTIFYFSYHMISGEKGLLEMIRLSNEVNIARLQSDENQAKRMNLEHKVNMMYQSSLDRDLLDEQARRVLGHSNKNEVIYMGTGKL